MSAPPPASASTGVLGSVTSALGSLTSGLVKGAKKVGNAAASGVSAVGDAAKNVVGAKPAADVAASSTVAPAGGRRRKSRKSKKSRKSRKTRHRR